MTVNINAANITSIRLADQSSAPTAPASNFIQLYADTNGDIATVKGGGGSIKIATSPATGAFTLTVTGTGTAARLNANQTFSGQNTFSSNIILSNGIGIDFSATPGTGDSELLDDYEAGAWTPTYTTSGNPFTSVTHDIQVGRYVKIGELVVATCTIRTSAVNAGTASGNVRISGLPFTTKNLANVALPGFISFSTGFAVNHPSSGGANTNSQVVTLHYRDAADGASLNLAPSDMATGANGNLAYLSISYFV
jgi:hypothetical protein